MSEMLSRLQARAVALPGAHTSRGYKATQFNVLDESSLDTFVEFPNNPTLPLLLRCADSDRERLVAQAPGVQISGRMKWGGPNWKWTEVPVDGSLGEPIIAELIAGSYQIVVAGLEDDGKFKLDLISRQLPPAKVLEKLISHFDLSTRAADIKRVVRTAFLLRTHTTNEDDLPEGRSKIGGHPDFPDDLTWPVFSNGKPLAFLAQVNLADLPKDAGRNGLPESGMLYLFSVYGWQSPDGADPVLPSGPYQSNWTKILYHSKTTALKRRAAPRNVEMFTAAEVEPIAILSLPMSGEEPAVSSLGWSEEERNRYESVAWAFTNVLGYGIGRPARHLLFGFADYVQCCVEQVAAGNLQLMFQIASDSNTKMEWGDGGNLYFWLPAADIPRLEFESVYADYQCG